MVDTPAKRLVAVQEVWRWEADPLLYLQRPLLAFPKFCGGPVGRKWVGWLRTTSASHI